MFIIYHFSADLVNVYNQATLDDENMVEMKKLIKINTDTKQFTL